MYIYICILGSCHAVTCIRVKNDEAAAWNVCNSVQVMDPVARFPCKSVQRRAWAGPCKSVQGGVRANAICAMEALCLLCAASC